MLRRGQKQHRKDTRHIKKVTNQQETTKTPSAKKVETFFFGYKKVNYINKGAKKLKK